MEAIVRLARPWLGAEEREAVSAVLERGMLVQGEEVAAFEAALARLTGRAHVIAVSSGTAALELALAALEVAGRDVLCPDLSWPSPAHAIVRAGARVRLVDVDPATWNATAARLGAARTDRTAAAIVIDQFGSPAAHEAIAEALDGVPIIVDAACAIGATLAGRPSAARGRIACLSFHPRKLVTTGEGGACLTDDETLAERLRVARNHGQAGAGVFRAAAGNFRLSEMAAAMGRAQLTRLDAMIARRREIAARYREAVGDRVRTQIPARGASPNEQTFGVVLAEGLDSRARDRVIDAMRARGVEAGRLSYALHRLPSLAGQIAEGGPYPVSERLEDAGVALPLHPLLSDDDVSRVIEAFDRALGAEER